MEDKADIKAGSYKNVSTTGFKHQKQLAIILAVTILLLLSFAYFGLHVGQKVYAQAAGHKAYKKDVSALIKNEDDINEKQAATVLANKYLTEALAKENNVQVTDQEIGDIYGPSITKQKKDNPYAYQNKVNQLYFNKLRANNNGIYKGELIVANFSRNIAYDSPLLADQKAADPNIGNPAAVAADKKYAQDFITNIYKQLKSGQLTFNRAAEIEKSDPTVGLKAYPTLSHSGPFDTTNSDITRNGLLLTSSIKQKIENIKTGKVTQPFVVSVPNSINPGDGKTAESYFLILHMDKAVNGNGLSFEQYLAQAEKRLGYKVNV